MSNNNNHRLGEAPLFHVIVSTGFGTGLIPGGRGTYGGMLALVIWLVLYFHLAPMALCVASIALVVVSFFVGIWTDNVMEKYWGEDPRAVVIDELFGTWISVLPALFYVSKDHYAITVAIVGFVMFRLIDITKPFGCRWIDRNIHGGMGCMLDDALAASYAAMIALLTRYFGVDVIIHDAVSSLWG